MEQLLIIDCDGIWWVRIPVSQDCGPFRPYRYMIDMFVQNVLQLQADHSFWRLFLLVTKPAVIGGVLLFMA